jgi:hypothetical protein
VELHLFMPSQLAAVVVVETQAVVAAEVSLGAGLLQLHLVWLVQAVQLIVVVAIPVTVM